MTRPVCWALSEGLAGTEGQCRGLAEALGYAPIVKRVAPRAPWKYLPNALWFNALAAQAPDGDRIEPPWPQIVISAGRKAAPIALAIRRESGARCIHIQNPYTDPARFDAVVAPRHDGLAGANVIVTRGGLHAVTKARLDAAARVFAPRFAPLKHPLIALLVGGPTTYVMTPEIVEPMARRVAAMAADSGGTLLVTMSRRTGGANEAAIRRGLEGSTAEIWDGKGDNPYLGYLALADAIVVTADSVSMTSEACTTGKPVYVYDLPGGSRRFRIFHEGLRAEGATRPFTGALESWSYAPLDDTAMAAAEIKRRVNLPT